VSFLSIVYTADCGRVLRIKLRRVGAIWFVFHVLQLLPVRLHNKTHAALAASTLLLLFDYYLVGHKVETPIHDMTV
jgi:hypothetical protein